MKGIDVLRRLGGGNAGGGGGTGVISLADNSVQGTQWAEWEIGSDGFTYVKDSSGPHRKSSPWIVPQSGMSSFEFRATILTGAPSGTFNVWLPFSNVSYDYGFVDVTGFHRASITAELRDAVSHTVVATATIFFSIQASL